MKVCIGTQVTGLSAHASHVLKLAEAYPANFSLGSPSSGSSYLSDPMDKSTRDRRKHAQERRFVGSDRM